MANALPGELAEGMTATQVLDDLIAYLRAQSGRAFVEIDEYGGEFSGGEVSRVSFRCPALLVACLGWQPPSSGSRMGGRFAARARLAAFIVTQDYGTRNSRMRMACDRAELVSALVTSWSPPGCVAKADGVRGENLYGAAVDKSGLALWSVTWWHDIELRQSRSWLDALPDLSGMQASTEARTHVPQQPVAYYPLPASHGATMAPCEAGANVNDNEE